MLKIKCFGEGVAVHHLSFEAFELDHLNAVAQQLQVSLEEALLDVRFYLDRRTPDSIYELTKQPLKGLLLLPGASIEIWFGRKKLAKLHGLELLVPQTLFPLYHLRRYQFNVQHFIKGHYLQEQHKGCIGIYTFDTDRFDIAELSFHIARSSFTETPFVFGFTYRNSPLKLEKEDVLTVKQQLVLLC